MMMLFGIDIRQTFAGLGAIPYFMRSLKSIKAQAAASDDSFPFGKLRPMLHDRSAGGGTASGHYFHQDLLVARKLFKASPERHVDVGSRIDGFVAHVASYRTIDVIDVRPLPKHVPNIRFLQQDLMQPLPERLTACCDSLSCLHALEHFGLGRYGERVDFEGHLIGFGNLAKMLLPGGRLYLSVPIGPQRIEFNAHRVFSLDYLLSLLDTDFRVESFSYVNDDGDLFEDVQLSSPLVGNNAGCNYGCGIFELVKRQPSDALAAEQGKSSEAKAVKWAKAIGLKLYLI